MRGPVYVNPEVPRPDSPFGLLRSCRQVYNEIRAQCYAAPVFYLFAPHQALRWVTSIGPQSSRSVQHLILKSSFLSMDANQVGRDIAIEAWARVLRAMPYLRQLTFDHTIDGPEWSTMVYPVEVSNASSALSDAIKNLGKLEQLSYMGGRVCNLELLKGKPFLTALRIGHAAISVKSPTEDIFPYLQNLRTLQLGEAFGRTREWPQFPERQNFGPATDISSLINVKYWKTQSLVFVKDQIPTSTLRLTYACVQEWKADSTPGTPELYYLLQNLPNLTYLGIEYNNERRILTEIPASVQKLDIILTEPDYFGHLERWWTGLKLTSEADVVLDFPFGEDKARSIGDSVYELLLQGRNEYFRWQERDSNQHIHQSGLIP